MDIDWPKQRPVPKSTKVFGESGGWSYFTPGARYFSWHRYGQGLNLVRIYLKTAFLKGDLEAFATAEHHIPDLLYPQLEPERRVKFPKATFDAVMEAIAHDGRLVQFVLDSIPGRYSPWDFTFYYTDQPEAACYDDLVPRLTSGDLSAAEDYARCVVRFLRFVGRRYGLDSIHSIWLLDEPEREVSVDRYALLATTTSCLVHSLFGKDLRVGAGGGDGEYTIKLMENLLRGPYTPEELPDIFGYHVRDLGIDAARHAIASRLVEARDRLAERHGKRVQVWCDELGFASDPQIQWEGGYGKLNLQDPKAAEGVEGVLRHLWGSLDGIVLAHAIAPREDVDTDRGSALKFTEEVHHGVALVGPTGSPSRAFQGLRDLLPAPGEEVPVTMTVPYAADTDLHHSTLWVSNLGAQECEVRVDFHGPDGIVSASRTTPLGAWASLELDNVVRWVMEKEGEEPVGAEGYLRISCQRQLYAVSSLVFNATSDPSVITTFHREIERRGFVPVVVKDGPYTTRLVVNNHSGTNAEISFQVHSPDGVPTGRPQALTLPPGAQRKFDDVITAMDLKPPFSGLLQISSTGPFTAFAQIYAQGVGGVMPSKPACGGSRRLVIPYVADRKGEGSEIGISSLAPADTPPARVSLALYSPEGILLGKRSAKVAPQSTVILVDAIRWLLDRTGDGEPLDMEGYIIMEADRPVHAYCRITSSATTAPSIFDVPPATSSMGWTLGIKTSIWATRLVVNSMGTSTATISLQAYGREGAPVGDPYTFTLPVACQKRFDHLLTAMGVPSLFTGGIRITADQPITAFVQQYTSAHVGGSYPVSWS